MPKQSVPSFQQIPLQQMERGLARPVATLRLEPAEIAKRVGLTFETAKDDLDELEAAVFKANSGRQIALVRHRHQPNRGTDILINERSRDLNSAVRDALQALNFEAHDLQWTSPKVSLRSLTRAPRVSGFRLSSASLHKAADIQERIERLQAELDQTLVSSAGAKTLTVRNPATRGQQMGLRGRGQRVAPSSGPLAPAVVRVLKSHGAPMRVSDILKGLLSSGYKFTSLEHKKNLFARIYRLKGVKQVGPGKFTAA
jgi:hypothetical protein